MGIEELLVVLKQVYLDYEEWWLCDFDDEWLWYKVLIIYLFYFGKYLVIVGQFVKFLVELGYILEFICDQIGGYGYNLYYDFEKIECKDVFEGCSL